MNLIKQLSLLAGALVIAACSSNSSKEQPEKLVKFQATAKLERNWSASAGDGQNKKQYNRIYPVIENGKLYASDTKGKLFAYDLASGKQTWRKNTRDSISGAIAVNEGVVFYGTLAAEVVAVSSASNEELWRVPVSSEVLSAPTTDGNVVIVQTSDSRLFALDVETGEQRWKFDHLPPVLSLRTTSSPINVSNQFIAAFDNGQVISVAANDGSTTWSARVAQPKGRSELERIVDVDGRPSVAGALILSASYQGNIVAINRGNGTVVWARPESTFVDLAVDANRVYSVSDKSIVTARSVFSGDSVWQNEQMRLRNLSAPAVIGDYVAVIDDEGYLHLLNSEDGSFAYRFKPRGNGFRSSMTIFEDQLIVLSDNGALTSYSLKK